MRAVFATFFEREWKCGAAEAMVRFLVPDFARAYDELPPVVIISDWLPASGDQVLAILHKLEIERRQFIHAGPVETHKIQSIDNDPELIALILAGELQSSREIIPGISRAIRPRVL